MGSFIASSYDCGSLILLLDSVMEIACSCVVGAGGAGSAELSSMLVVGTAAVGTVAVGSVVAAISVRTFFGLPLGLGSPGGAFFFVDRESNGHWLSSFASCSDSSIKGSLTMMTCLVWGAHTRKFLLVSGL